MKQSLSLTRSHLPSIATWAMPTAAWSNVARLISSFVRSNRSTRFRASALANICASNCSRLISTSGQSRSALMVLRPKTPMGSSPPTESGRVRFDLTPNRRQLSRSTSASAGSSSSEEMTTMRLASICFTHQGKCSSPMCSGVCIPPCA